MDSESPLSETQDIIDVMIVDDAPIVRKLYQRMLERNPYVDVVAIAENGLEALIKQCERNIDVVILDIEMPVMNGMEALERLLYYDSDVMVMMASTLNWESAEITHIALANGAADYLEKPSAVRRNLNAEQFQDYMNEKVLTLGLKRKKILEQQVQYSEAVRQKRQQIQSKKLESSADNDHEARAKGFFVNEVDYQPAEDAEPPKKSPPKPKPKKQTAEDSSSPLDKLVESPKYHLPHRKRVGRPTVPIQPTPPKPPVPAAPPVPVAAKSKPLAADDAENIKRQQKILKQARENVFFNQTQGQLRACPKNFTPKAIAIGASTGGPPLIQKLIPELAQFQLPIFLTQHMPDFFTSVLAEQVSRRGGVDAREVNEDMEVESTSIYIAHGGNHLGVRREGGKIIAFQDQNTPPEHCCKPSVEVMLSHLMDVYQGDILLIILTGMGRDGSVQAEALVDKGGVVVVQDEASSLIWGMPGVVMQKGLATAALPPTEIYQWCRQMLTFAA